MVPEDSAADNEENEDGKKADEEGKANSEKSDEDGDEDGDDDDKLMKEMSEKILPQSYWDQVKAERTKERIDALKPMMPPPAVPKPPPFSERNNLNKVLKARQRMRKLKKQKWNVPKKEKHEEKEEEKQKKRKSEAEFRSLGEQIKREELSAPDISKLYAIMRKYPQVKHELVAAGYKIPRLEDLHLPSRAGSRSQFGYKLVRDLSPESSWEDPEGEWYSVDNQEQKKFVAKVKEQAKKKAQDRKPYKPGKPFGNFKKALAKIPKSKPGPKPTEKSSL